MLKSWPWVVSAGALGLCAMLVAGFAMVWLKMENRIKAVAWSGTIIIFIGLILTGIYVIRLTYKLRTDVIIHGDVQIEVGSGGGAVNLEDFSLHAPQTAGAATAPEAAPEAMPAAGATAPANTAQPNRSSGASRSDVGLEESTPFWKKVLGIGSRHAAAPAAAQQAS
mmetsp:Transcript_40068/g.105951  ORF Transcript_40068/g.105951 Transcript_40068/m.105951 type:complete len:167 (+) Transcript_40068:178-678(+)